MISYSGYSVIPVITSLMAVRRKNSSENSSVGTYLVVKIFINFIYLLVTVKPSKSDFRIIESILLTNYGLADWMVLFF